MISLTDLKELVKTDNVQQSRKGFRDWRKSLSQAKKDEIPYDPLGYYQGKLKSWDDLFGKNKYTLHELKALIRNHLRLTGVDPRHIALQAYYSNVIRSSEDPRIPSNPWRYYGNEWPGFDNVFRGKTDKPAGKASGKRRRSKVMPLPVVPKKKRLSIAGNMVSKMTDNLRSAEVAYDNLKNVFNEQVLRGYLIALRHHVNDETWPLEWYILSEAMVVITRVSKKISIT